MRVIVFVRASSDGVRDFVPSPWATEMMEAKGRFNDDLTAAGILVKADGLKPSAHGKGVAFDGPARMVTDGPFTETKEMVAGFWLWNAKGMGEAVARVRRCPHPMPGPGQIEFRPLSRCLTRSERAAPTRGAVSLCAPPLIIAQGRLAIWTGY